MEITNIEKFFLNTLLRISMGGVLLILISDAVLYPDDVRSMVIDVIVLTACLLSYAMRKHYQTVSVLILTVIVLSAMIYQCIAVPMSTTNSLSVILLVGFIFSVMLKGATLWSMHAIAVLAVNGLFVYQFLHFELQYTRDRNEMATVTITYSIIYLILNYATVVLKASYDRLHSELRENNIELQRRANEIAAQNEELVQIQENINAINSSLESIVDERTAKIQHQNEILLRYAYTNAHHLRGPVARLLGLASISQLEPRPDPNEIIAMMAAQAVEIDAVISQINTDLESGHVGN